jgi:hypothetical protein
MINKFLKHILIIKTMKKKIAFLALLITISAFSFGQKPGLKEHGAIKNPRIENGNTKFEEVRKKDAPDRLIKFHQEKHTPFQLKNVADTKQRLDSVTTEVNNSAAQRKDEYTYNEDGLVTLRLGLSRTSPSNPWSYQSKDVHAYNEMGFPTLVSYYNYSTINEQWIGQWKEEGEYNDEGQWTSWAVYYDWDYENNEWIGAAKQEVIYDEFGKVVQSLFYEWDAQSAIHWALNRKSDYYWEENSDTLTVTTYEWDTANQIWVNFEKSIAALNNFGYTTFGISYIWSDTINEWQNNRKYEYFYDSNGNDTLNLRYIWNIDESQWVPEFKIEYTYEDNSNLIREEYFQWDIENSKWITSGIYEAEYDENGNPLIELYHYLNILHPEYSSMSKYEYSFDENSNLLSASEYYSDYLNTDWVGLNRIECSYNLNFTKDDLIIPFICHPYYSGYLCGNNMLTGEKEFGWNEGNWELLDESFYHYSEQASGIEKHYTEAGLLYPNPASNQITIQLPADQMQGLLQIYNLHGSLLMQKVITGKDQIQIDFLDVGFYVYQITFGNEKYYGKFVKE